jgi:hypothetical protein
MNEGIAAAPSPRVDEVIRLRTATPCRFVPSPLSIMC